MVELRGDREALGLFAGCAAGHAPVQPSNRIMQEHPFGHARFPADPVFQEIADFGFGVLAEFCGNLVAAVRADGVFHDALPAVVVFVGDPGVCCEAKRKVAGLAVHERPIGLHGVEPLFQFRHGRSIGFRGKVGNLRFGAEGIAGSRKLVNLAS